MTAPQQFSLRWNNYSQHIVTALDDLRADDELTDVTLSCDSKRLKAHKVLLSACSTFFRDTFKENPCKHPVVIIKGVCFADLEAVVTFMYNGQVNVSQDRLQTFLAAAELLQIKGLTDMNEKSESNIKKRVGTLSSSNNNTPSASASRSGTPDNIQRPLETKRKRILADDGNASSSSSPQNHSVPSPLSSSGKNNNNGTSSAPPPLIIPKSSSTSFSSQNLPFSNSEQCNNVKVKYEVRDDEIMSSEELDNENSIQDLMCSVEPASCMGVSSGQGEGVGTSGTESSHGYSYDLEYEEVLNSNDEDDEIWSSDSYNNTISCNNGNIRPVYKRTQRGNTSACDICGKRYVHSCTLVQHKKLHEADELDEFEYEEMESEILYNNNESEDLFLSLTSANKSTSITKFRAVEGGRLLKIKPEHGTAVFGGLSLVKKPMPGLLKTGSHLNIPNFSLTRELLGEIPIGSSSRTFGPSTKIKKEKISSINMMMGLATEPPLYICHLCNKTYVHQRSLKDHMKAHRGLTRCPACGKSFSKVANMRAHYNVQHGEGKKEADESLEGLDVAHYNFPTTLSIFNSIVH